MTVTEREREREQRVGVWGRPWWGSKGGLWPRGNGAEKIGDPLFEQRKAYASAFKKQKRRGEKAKKKNKTRTTIVNPSSSDAFLAISYLDSRELTARVAAVFLSLSAGWCLIRVYLHQVSSLVVMDFLRASFAGRKEEGRDNRRRWRTLSCPTFGGCAPSINSYSLPSSTLLRAVGPRRSSGATLSICPRHLVPHQPPDLDLLEGWARLANVISRSPHKRASLLYLFRQPGDQEPD